MEEEINKEATKETKVEEVSSLKERNEKKRNVIRRLITAFFLIVICLPCVLLGTWYYFFLSILIIGLTGYEVVKISNPTGKFKIVIYVVTLILLFLIVYWVLLENILLDFINETNEITGTNLFNYFNEINIPIIVVAIAALIYFFISFIDMKYSIAHVFYYFGMVVFIGVCFQSLIYLRFGTYNMFVDYYSSSGYLDSALFKYAHSGFLVLYMLIGVCFNDAGAYLIGMLFGKHKMNPKISPKKTWEGCIGGIIISFAISFTFGITLAAVGYPLIPNMDLSKWYIILIISLIIPFTSVIGDLIFSAIKRYFVIKDFSGFLSGHGGILDRFDSILFTSVFVALIITFVNEGFLQAFIR